MRKAKIHPLILLILVLAAAALACNLPGAGGATSTANGPQSTMTVLAKTIEAVLTKTAASENGEPTEIATNTLEPSATPQPTNTLRPTNPPTAVPPTAVPCDAVWFIDDITIPDGTIVSPSKAFTKTWRLKNAGSCTWTTAYAIVFDSGTAMDGPASTSLPGSVSPGQTIDLSVNLKAPSSNGTYRGNWKLRNGAGAVFGLGGNKPFYVEIQVATATPAPVTTVYDFITKMCAAGWKSGAGALPCPGTDSDNTGFVIKRDNPKLETGSNANAPALETHPEWVENGVIQGTYPAIAIKTGYRFKARIGCMYNATSCNANFVLKYSADGDPWTNLSPSAGWNETYDSTVRTLDIDLSSLNGKNVQFLFEVNANGPTAQNWALWVSPRITK